MKCDLRLPCFSWYVTFNESRISKILAKCTYLPKTYIGHYFICRMTNLIDCSVYYTLSKLSLKHTQHSITCRPLTRNQTYKWSIDMHHGSLWPPCVADADIIFLPCSFYLLSSFLFLLISAAADWMSTILPHMVWP